MTQSWNESYLYKVENIEVGGCKPYVMTREEIIKILRKIKEKEGEKVKELKPCPFCGRTDTLRFDRYKSDGEWWGYIECTECIMTGPVGKLKQDVVEAWNKRSEQE